MRCRHATKISCSRCNAHRRNPRPLGLLPKQLDADVFVMYGALRIVTLESYRAVANLSPQAISASVPIRRSRPLHDFLPVNRITALVLHYGVLGETLPGVYRSAAVSLCHPVFDSLAMIKRDELLYQTADGRTFESCRAHHVFNELGKFDTPFIRPDG
jgi:hypothetical protein